MPADDFIQEALERFKLAQEAEDQWKRQCEDDLRFSLGEIDGQSTQWRYEDQKARQDEARPCLTLNRVPQFVRQVTNEGRQNRASINISPVDDSGDIETAEIIQGLIRHIEANSFADIARDTAREHMCRMGFAYTRLRTDYADEESFDQEIYLERVLNPFSVYMDPGAMQPDRSDATWAFVTSEVTEEQHRRMWPKAELSTLSRAIGAGDLGDWVGEKKYRIAEYFYSEPVKRKLRKFQVPDIGLVAGFEEDFPPGMPFVEERIVEIPRIHWCKMNGLEKLEEGIWPGRFIPLIPWIADEFLIGGRRHISGMTRGARPAQYMYNFWVSALTEMVGTLPKAPWVIAEGQTEGYEHLWQTAHVQNHPALIYKASSFEGHLLPPPARNFAEPPINAITAAIFQADRDLKATFGIYEAGLGERGPQESGRAINARKVESETGTYHLISNELRAIRYEGRQMLNLIQVLYDRERVARIIMPDETPQTVTLNGPTMWKGAEKVFDVRVGRYDVRVSAGPGYETKRQQAAAQQTELIRAFPEIMPVAGDLMVRAMDIPGSQEIADRLKKTLPPNLQEPEDGQQPIPPQAQQLIQNLMQQHEELTAALNAANDELEKKTQELQSKERIAAMQDETKREVAMLQEETKRLIANVQSITTEAVAAVKADVDRLKMQSAERQGREDREVAREGLAAKGANNGSE